MGWDNPSRTLTPAHPELTIRTNWTATTPTSWTDHILTYRSPNTPTLLGGHLARSPSTISDKHRLFWNSFRILGGSPHPRQRPTPCPYHRKKREVPNIFRDKHTTAEYQTKMADWFNIHPCPLAPTSSPKRRANTSSKSVKPPPKSALVESNGSTNGGNPTVMDGHHTC